MQSVRIGCLEPHYGCEVHPFKSGVPQRGVLSPTLFNTYTADLPQP